MKNETGKKILLLFFILVLIAVGGIEGYYIYNLKNNNNTTNNVEKGEVYANNNEESVKNVEAHVVEKEVEKIVEKEVVKSLIGEKVIKNKYLGDTKSGEKAYLNAVLPQFNVDTTEAKKVNEEILKLENADKYFNKAQQSGYVTYTSKYIAEKNIYMVKITKQLTTWAGSGSGISYYSYFYDSKNNKFLTKNDVLKLYGITKENILNKALDEISYLGENDEKDKLQRDKNNAKEEINNGNFEISDIDSLSKIRITVPYMYSGIEITLNDNYKK